MIRGKKDVDWGKHLSPEEMSYLVSRVDPNGWYPMLSFERMGNAILKEIAGGQVEAARMWGRISVDQLRMATPQLFDFDALEVKSAISNHAAIVIHYHMGAMAEEAASNQTMGFFERLLVIAGAEGVDARFTSRSWKGDKQTLLELHWQPPNM